MKVIFKATGQTGTIPDNKFDPKLFDQVVDTGAPAPLSSGPKPSPQLTSSPNKKSLGGFVKNVGSDIGTTLQGLGAIPGLAKSIIKGDVGLGEVGGAIGSGIFNEYKDLITNPVDTAYNKPISSLLNVLPVGQFSKLGKAKYAAKAGDVASDLGKAGKAADVVGDVARTGKNFTAITETGAAYSPIDDIVKASKNASALEKTSAKASKVIGPLERTGRRFRENVAGASGGSSALAGQNIDEVMDFGKARGYAGAPRNQLAQVSEDYLKTSEEIGRRLPTVKSNPIKATEVVNDLKARLRGNVNFNQYLRSSGDLIDNYSSFVTEKAKNGILSTQDVFELKNDLFKQVAKIKVGKPGEIGPQVAQKGAVASELYDTLNDTLGNMAPEIKDLTTLQAQMHSYAKGPAFMTAPIPSTNVVWKLVQPLMPAADKLVDNIGRALWAAGSDFKLDKAVSGISKLTKSLLGPRTIARQAMAGTPIGPLVHLVGRQADKMEKPQGAQEFTDMMGTSGGTDPISSGAGMNIEGFEPGIDPQTAFDLQLRFSPDEEVGGTTKRKISPEMAMMAQLVLSAENAKKIQAAYDIQEKSLEGEDVDKDTKKRQRMLTSAGRTYTTLLQLSLMSEDGWKGFVAAQGGKLPGVDGSYAEDLSRVTNGLARQLGQTFAGEVGVATDQDIARWQDLAPKPGDTYAERVRALQRMKDMIESDMEVYGL